jgi:4-hydroxyphenylpyruvate dioxygenase
VGPDTDRRSIYENDFTLFTHTAPDRATTIDHVAQALPHGRMDGFVLFYRAIFGLEPQQLWELPDPYGLIQSRAMVSPDGSVRLPLNFSESRETATGRFVTAYAGAGVHHIAFSTDDIVATVQRITALGAPMLPVPANYYDDLAARHGLDDALLAELARWNLLYDRDEAGEFLHAYTDTFHDRFFFEIVERRGYQGFGAANASVRMAAQAARRDTGLSTRLALL